MRIDHPAEWEMTLASGVDEPCRCIFSDRLYQRLDVRWKPVKYVPNLDLMLDKHRARHDKDTKVRLENFDDAGPEWRGVVRKGDAATVVHAGRFFRDERILVEATIIWPKRREKAVEKAILATIAPLDGKAAVTSWQALGLRVSIGSKYVLRTADLQVGRVGWTFDLPGKRNRLVTVERLAMPEHWLKGPLVEWLAEQLPQDFSAHDSGPTKFAGHQAHKLLSRGRANPLNRLRGRRRLRLDVAWQCDSERRVYRATVVDVVAGDEIDLPGDLSIWCCRAPAPLERPA
jgi:hypothetical protein